MSHRLSVRAAVVAVAICSLANVGPGIADADVQSTTGANCVEAAAQVGDQPGTPVCFARFDDAISFATGGQVQLADAAVSRAVSADELAGLSPDVDSPISIMYADTNYGGASYTWTGAACTATHSYADPGMPSGWNDRVSSMLVYQNCTNRLYVDASYGGAFADSGRNGSEPTLGTLNDKGSSEKWFF
jgi:Peptidase inhibitor family I36